MNKQNVTDTIQQLLTAAFNPSQINVIDESAQHLGHPGAREGGHYAVEIISTAFEGKNLVERHRLIYQALNSLMKTKIHALRIQAKTPVE